MTTFTRPYRLAPRDTYCVVLDADGCVVAQGSHELCTAVVEGRYGWTHYGAADLFGESRNG